MLLYAAYDLPMLWRTLMTLCGTLWNIFLNCPSLYFLMMYGDLCVILIMWGKCIEKLESTVAIIEESKHFIDALNKVATVISSPIFWIITQLQIGLILWVFVSLTFFFFPTQSGDGKMVQFKLTILTQSLHFY